MRDFWPAYLENITQIICWTFLAMFFGKWWIALFSIIFMNTCGRRKDEESEGEEHHGN